jgi:hypothetical protein
MARQTKSNRVGIPSQLFGQRPRPVASSDDPGRTCPGSAVWLIGLLRSAGSLRWLRRITLRPGRLGASWWGLRARPVCCARASADTRAAYGDVSPRSEGIRMTFQKVAVLI